MSSPLLTLDGRQLNMLLPVRRPLQRKLIGARVFHSSKQWSSMRDVQLEAQRSDAGGVCQAPCHDVDAQSPSDARRTHLTRS